MKVFSFKTNIKCSGCLARVTATLNETAGEGNWDVDTAMAEKRLTVKGSRVSPEDIIKSVKIAGFTAERLD
jgi:copper chaperone